MDTKAQYYINVYYQCVSLLFLLLLSPSCSSSSFSLLLVLPLSLSLSSSPRPVLGRLLGVGRSNDLSPKEVVPHPQHHKGAAMQNAGIAQKDHQLRKEKGKRNVYATASGKGQKRENASGIVVSVLCPQHGMRIIQEPQFPKRIITTNISLSLFRFPHRHLHLGNDPHPQSRIGQERPFRP